MSQQRQAAELMSLQQALTQLPHSEAYAKVLIKRLSKIRKFKAGAKVVDVGAAQGLLLIAFAKLGYNAVGIEPFEQARMLGRQISEQQGVSIKLLHGVAENLGLESESCDLVLAKSVVEHVVDINVMFREIYRVLKPEGIFWFYTTNCLCPYQNEISGFPCFSWYPHRLKLRIMNWAKVYKPHLVGHTQHPAVNWLAPWSARRALRAAGFAQIYDRWELHQGCEERRIEKLVIGAMKICPLLKIVGDVMISDSSYAAVKKT